MNEPVFLPDSAPLGPSAAEKRWPPLLWLLFIYLASIVIFGKGPTYLGIGRIFWGEVVMGVLLIWVAARVLRDGVMGDVPTALFFLVTGFLAYGGVVLGLSLAGRSDPFFDVIRDSAVCYYALFFFVGLHVAGRPGLADRLWQRLQIAWLLALVWYVLRIATGNWSIRIAGKVPRRNVYLLWGSTSENVQHTMLGAMLLLLLPERIRRLRIPALVSILAILAALTVSMICPARGVKLGIFLAGLAGIIATVGARHRLWPSGRLAIIAYGAVNAILVVAILSGPTGLLEVGKLHRFRTIWSSQGTAYWRRLWWSNLHDEVCKGPDTMLYGLGFGPNLGMYNPSLVKGHNDERAWPVRSPHSVNMTIYARMGITGAVLWAGILGCGLGGIFWRIRTGRNRHGFYTRERLCELTFWLMVLIATWVNSSFGVLMEGPVLGVLFWFALGFAHGRALGRDGIEPLVAAPEQAKIIS